MGDKHVDLSGYAYPTVSNAPSTPGVHEYWNTFTEVNSGLVLDDCDDVGDGSLYVTQIYFLSMRKDQANM